MKIEDEDLDHAPLYSSDVVIYWVPGTNCVIAQHKNLPDPITPEDVDVVFNVSGAVDSAYADLSFIERGNYLRMLYCIMVARDNVDPDAAYNCLAQIDCFSAQMPSDMPAVRSTEQKPDLAFGRHSSEKTIAVCNASTNVIPFPLGRKSDLST